MPPDVEERKGLAAVGYLGPLFLVPLLAKKENAFYEHHGKQGAVLFGLEVIGAVVLIILSKIISFVRFVSCGGGTVSLLLWVVFAVCALGLSIWGIVMASRGEYWKMPVVGDVADKIKF